MSDDIEKTPNPIKKTLLRPKRSPSEPPTSNKADKNSAYPLITHNSSVPVIPRSFCRAGNATFKAVLSINTRLDARIVDRSVHFCIGVNPDLFEPINVC